MTKYNKVRQPAVAGQFYPADASRLKFKINEYLKAVETPLDPPLSGGLKAIIAPHAGYDYSGPVAAYGYKQLEGRQIDNVFIIGNSHSAYFDGIAVDDLDSWQTPLGEVEVNKELAKKIVATDKVLRLSRAEHKNDHCLEVQLPFLQIVLPSGFKIVPILFGNTDPTPTIPLARGEGAAYKKLAQALKENLGANDIVIISTDMSHYPSYEDANKIDQATLEIIKSAAVSKLDEHIEKIMSSDVDGEETLICGVDGVKTIMELYNLVGWNQIEILHYANSGDTAAGDKERVVGYGAVAFAQVESPKSKVQSQNELSDEQKKVLLDIARQTVESYARNQEAPELKITDERLKQQAGAFVTLHKDGQLRGCIGQIAPSDQPLREVVRDMALAAASDDPRFNPVSADELPFLEYEVSVLSVPEKINNWRDIKLGVHGVIVQKGWHSGVFLPQVATETGWDLETFLSALCSEKAGLPADCYKNDSEVIIKIFSAQVF